MADPQKTKNKPGARHRSSRRKSILDSNSKSHAPSGKMPKERADYAGLLLHALMETIPDQIYVKDLNSRFTRINKAQARVLGLKDPREALGKTDFDFFAEEHAAQAFADEQEVIRTGMSIVAQEEKETWPDGHETWVSTTKAPLHDEEGNIIGTLGISRNITPIKRHEQSRKQLEARMQHADKMESLGMLASGIAHDFNNLLMGVLGNASLALSSLSENEPVWSIVKQIETASLRAADLTNQLLAYSGRGDVAIKTLNLEALVREMASLLEITISRNVALRYNFSENLPYIEGDATQIRQVIMNLITNASEAIGEKSGTITISTGVVDCDETYLTQTYVADKLKPGRYVYLEISDTGCGIDHRVRKKIFDPFFTTKPTGRGLGLAIALGIIRGHKGALEVYSEVGKGTTFKVLLRASESPTVIRERKEKEKAREWRGTGTVLIVDDEDIIREVAVQMLAALGFTPLFASSGEEALEIFKKNKDEIAVVLLDEVMPRMDGEEVFTAMRRVRPDIRIILCSGYTEQDATARFVGKGLSGFIQKPFTLQTLAEKMRPVLEESRPRSIP